MSSKTAASFASLSHFSLNWLTNVRKVRYSFTHLRRRVPDEYIRIQYIHHQLPSTPINSHQLELNPINSSTTIWQMLVRGYFVASNRRMSSAWNIYNWAWHIVAASTFWYLDVIQKGSETERKLACQRIYNSLMRLNLWMNKESLLCVRNLFVFAVF